MLDQLGITALPPGFKLIAATGDVPMAGMADEARDYYAVQFHPEVTHTKQGARNYSRFVHDICGCGESWIAGSIIDDVIARVRAQRARRCRASALLSPCLEQPNSFSSAGKGSDLRSTFGADVRSSAFAIAALR
jgi:Glutamine amidotransferase class-I